MKYKSTEKYNVITTIRYKERLTFNVCQVLKCHIFLNLKFYFCTKVSLRKSNSESMSLVELAWCRLAEKQKKRRLRLKSYLPKIDIPKYKKQFRYLIWL